MKYRIVWRSPETGRTEKGTVLFPSAEIAQEVAGMMEVMWPGSAHWAELAEDQAGGARVGESSAAQSLKGNSVRRSTV
jgi:hypothetical protein